MSKKCRQNRRNLIDSTTRKKNAKHNLRPEQELFAEAEELQAQGKLWSKESMNSKEVPVVPFAVDGMEADDESDDGEEHAAESEPAQEKQKKSKKQKVKIVYDDDSEEDEPELHELLDVDERAEAELDIQANGDNDEEVEKIEMPPALMKSVSSRGRVIKHKVLQNYF